jgi:hypothetical protein
MEASSRRWALYKTLNCVALLSTLVETWVTFVSEGAESVLCGVLQVAVLVLLGTAGYCAQMLEDRAREQQAGRRQPGLTAPRLPSPDAVKRAAAKKAGDRAMVAFQERLSRPSSRPMSGKKRGTAEELEGLATSPDGQVARDRSPPRSPLGVLGP